MGRWSIREPNSSLTWGCTYPGRSGSLVGYPNVRTGECVCSSSLKARYAALSRVVPRTSCIACSSAGRIFWSTAAAQASLSFFQRFSKLERDLAASGRFSPSKPSQLGSTDKSISSENLLMMPKTFDRDVPPLKTNLFASVWVEKSK